MANERFVANAERITRFSEHLFLGGDEEERIKGGGGGNNDCKKKEEGWEDGEVRQARKRAEGLKIQAGMIKNSIPNKAIDVVEEGEEDVDLSFFIPTVSSE